MRLEFQRPPTGHHYRPLATEILSALRLFGTSHRTRPNSILPITATTGKSNLQIHGSVTQNRKTKLRLASHDAMERTFNSRDLRQLEIEALLIKSVISSDHAES